MHMSIGPTLLEDLLEMEVESQALEELSVLDLTALRCRIPSSTTSILEALHALAHALIALIQPLQIRERELSLLKIFGLMKKLSLRELDMELQIKLSFMTLMDH